MASAEMRTPLASFNAIPPHPHVHITTTTTTFPTAAAFNARKSTDRVPVLVRSHRVGTGRGGVGLGVMVVVGGLKAKS